MIMGLTTKTNIYISVYNELEPLINYYLYSKGFSEMARLVFLISYISSLNKGFNILMSKPNEDNLKLQLGVLTSTFNTNKEVHNGVILAILRYLKNKMLVEHFKHISLSRIINLQIKQYEDLKKSLKIENKNFREHNINSIETNNRSYVWLGDEIQDQLKTLYIKFKDEHKLIDNKTEFIDFLKAFNGTKLNEIKNKINWKGPFRALIYFIIRAFHRQHIEGDDNVRWKQLESTFDYKGNPLTVKKCLSEFYKLNSTEHIPNVGPQIDLIFRSFI